MTSRQRTKWYGKGLAFACSGCGRCCSGPEEGYVWITADEISVAAALRAETVGEFKRKYCRRIGLRYSLIEQQPSKDCIFLESRQKQGKYCQIYEARPLQCRTWPFWKDNIRSQRAWDTAADRCPGIDKGLWHEAGTIEAISNGRLVAGPCGQGAFETAIEWIADNLDNGEAQDEVSRIYERLDGYLVSSGADCRGCGQCCDFGRFGHRLFAGTLEMLFFVQGMKDHKAAKRTVGQDRCPYQAGSQCGVRDVRPAGCRIFFCRGLPREFQNELAEQIVQNFRELHRRLEAVYYYGDVQRWLEGLVEAGLLKIDNAARAG